MNKIIIKFMAEGENINYTNTKTKFDTIQFPT